MDNLVKIAREGFCGDRCRVMKADLGCTCSALADRIESQAADLSAKQRIIDAQAGMIAQMQEKMRRLIDPMKLFRWGSASFTRQINTSLFLGNLWVGHTFPGDEGKHYASITGGHDAGLHPTESEARTAVERVVLSALGIGHVKEDQKPLHVEKTCKGPSWPADCEDRQSCFRHRASHPSFGAHGDK